MTEFIDTEVTDAHEENTRSIDFLRDLTAWERKEYADNLRAFIESAQLELQMIEDIESGVIDVR